MKRIPVVRSTRPGGNTSCERKVVPEREHTVGGLFVHPSFILFPMLQQIGTCYQLEMPLFKGLLGLRQALNVV